MPYFFNEDTSKVNADDYIDKRIESYLKNHVGPYDLPKDIMKNAMFSVVEWRSHFDMMGSTVGIGVWSWKDINLPTLRPLAISGFYFETEAGENCSETYFSDLRLDIDEGTLNGEVTRAYGSDRQQGTAAVQILYVYKGQ